MAILLLVPSKEPMLYSGVITLRFSPAMLHRHLTHQNFTLTAIDDVIDRGGKADWLELRSAALSDPSIQNRIRKVCAAHLADPYAQRYHFWMHYFERSAA